MYSIQYTIQYIVVYRAQERKYSYRSDRFDKEISGELRQAIILLTFLILLSTGSGIRGINVYTGYKTVLKFITADTVSTLSV